MKLRNRASEVSAFSCCLLPYKQDIHETQRKAGAPCLSGFSIQGAFDSNRRNYSLIWREMEDVLQRPESGVKNDGR